MNHQLISESSLNRILGKHFKEGFIIISNFRGDGEKTDNENKTDFSDLKRKVRTAGFGFIPVYGGYIEDKGTPAERKVLVPALIIANRMAASFRAYSDDKKLFDLGVELINEYNQDSFLFKPMGDDSIAHYIDKSGNIEMTFIGKVVYDLIIKYFTDLTKEHYTSIPRTDGKNNKTFKRFTFTGNLFINKSPKDMQEAISRYGEEFFNVLTGINHKA